MPRLTAKQFAAYFVALSVGFAMMIPNVRWMSIVGCGVLLTATGSVRGWKRMGRVWRALFVMALAVVNGFRAAQRGDFWAGDLLPSRELVAIFAAWILSVAIEYRAWRNALALRPVA